MIGSLAFWLGIRRRVTLENLARAFPQLGDRERRVLARASYEQLATSLWEIAFRKPQVSFEGWEIYQKARAAGRGVVCAIANEAQRLRTRAALSLVKGRDIEISF